MKLGSHVFILLPAQDLTANVQFFEQLGYTRVADCQSPQSFSIVSDGKIHLILDEGYFGGKGILYFQAHIEAALETLKNRGLTFSIKNHSNQGSLQATITDSDGCKIILSNHPIFRQLSLPSSPTKIKIGQLSEVTLTVENIDESILFWKKLGFDCVFYRSWQRTIFGRAILKDGLISIGLHQTKQFEGLKLTYLDSEMPKKILGVKKLGISTTFEMVALQNNIYAAAGIEAPNGTELFLFKRSNYLDLMHFPEYKAQRIGA